MQLLFSTHLPPQETDSPELQTTTPQISDMFHPSSWTVCGPPQHRPTIAALAGQAFGSIMTVDFLPHPPPDGRGTDRPRRPGRRRQAAGGAALRGGGARAGLDEGEAETQGPRTQSVPGAGSRQALSESHEAEQPALKKTGELVALSRQNVPCGTNTHPEAPV